MISYLKIYDPISKKNIDTLTKRGGKVIKKYMEAYRNKILKQKLLVELLKHMKHRQQQRNCIQQPLVPIHNVSIFLENMNFVFLSNMICKIPKVVEIGAKKIT